MFNYKIVLIYIFLFAIYICSYKFNSDLRSYVILLGYFGMVLYYFFIYVIDSEYKKTKNDYKFVLSTIEKTLPVTIKNTYLKCSNPVPSEKSLYLSWNYVGQHIMGYYYDLVLIEDKNEKSKFNMVNNNSKFLRPFYRNFFKQDTSSDKLFDNIYNLNEIQFLTNDFNKNIDEFLELEKCEDNENEYMLKTRKRYKSGAYSYLYIGKDNKLEFDPKDNDFSIARFILEDK